LGRSFESVFVDVPNGASREPSFTAINPLQQIPVLDDDGYIVQDSQAILVYLARRFRPEWIGNDAFESGAIAQWLSFAANEIGNSLQPARVFYLLGEHTDINLVQRKGLRVLRLLDAHLARHEWLACKRPTIADLACFPYVGLCREGKLPLDDFPHVLTWLQHVVALDGYVAMPGLPDPARA
jgi:glutathione S-transferase